MDLTISNETNTNLDYIEDIYNELLIKTLKHLNLNENVIIGVTFVDKEKIQDINKTYRNIDRPTDVISFAFLDDKNEIIVGEDIPLDLGELYICYDVAIENAKRYGNSDLRELKFLFIHGLLHLLGYDHMKEEDEKIMFKLQDEILEA